MADAPKEKPVNRKPDKAKTRKPKIDLDPILEVIGNRRYITEEKAAKSNLWVVMISIGIIVSLFGSLIIVEIDKNLIFWGSILTSSLSRRLDNLYQRSKKGDLDRKPIYLEKRLSAISEYLRKGPNLTQDYGRLRKKRNLQDDENSRLQLVAHNLARLVHETSKWRKYNEDQLREHRVLINKIYSSKVELELIMSHLRNNANFIDQSLLDDQIRLSYSIRNEVEKLKKDFYASKKLDINIIEKSNTTTTMIVRSASVIGMIIISIYLIQIFLSQSRYYTSLSTMLAFQSSALQASEGDPVLLEKLLTSLAPGVEFGDMPLSILDKAFDTAKAFASKAAGG